MIFLVTLIIVNIYFMIHQHSSTYKLTNISFLGYISFTARYPFHSKISIGVTNNNNFTTGTPTAVLFLSLLTLLFCPSRIWGKFFGLFSWQNASCDKYQLFNTDMILNATKTRIKNKRSTENTTKEK